MTVQEWAIEFAKLDPGDSEWDWRGRRQAFATHIGEIVDQASNLTLTEEQWDRIAATAARTSANILWDERESLQFRLELIDRLSELVRLVASKTPSEHFGTRMFWDVIAIQARPIDPRALPSVAVSTAYQAPEVSNAIFESITRQLQMHHKELQLSALQGLSQLGNPGTASFIESVRHMFMDEEVRRTAKAAARFDLI